MAALDKKQIRKIAIQRRLALSKEEWQSKSAQITETFLHSSFFDINSTLGIYMPIKQEVNTLILLEYCFKQHKSLAIPKVLGNEMKFFYIESMDDVEIGAFHVLEPKITDKIADDIETLVVPLVAFSEDKNRIGYGKGYYDRYLKAHQLKTIGFAFENQKFEFTKENHDIPLDHIITEVKIY